MALSEPVHFDEPSVAVEAWGVSLPKAGHAWEENEDAFALAVDGMWPIHAAVADGATESAFARAWAQTLVQGYASGTGDTPRAMHERLPAWQAAWQQEISVRSDQLPWYAAAKAEEGAYAALIGFTLYPSHTWQATAIGDCCLFHVRGGTVRQTWPFTEAEAFGYHPALVPSRSGTDGPEIAVQDGAWAPGDTFWLASDAVAAWLMHTGIADLHTQGPEAVRARLQHARAEGALRNDDSTFAVLHLTKRST